MPGAEQLVEDAHKFSVADLAAGVASPHADQRVFTGVRPGGPAVPVPAATLADRNPPTGPADRRTEGQDKRRRRITTAARITGTIGTGP